MRKRIFKSAPLPFIGQKRFFVNDFSQILTSLQGEVDTVVDLFGGSGLLSHTAKAILPEARVVYNDFDGYRERITNIPQTNKILSEIRPLLIDIPRGKRIPKHLKAHILDIIARYANNGFVDFQTVGGSLLFSGGWATSLDGLRQKTFYNNIRQNDYEEARDYLDGIEVVGMDYRELFAIHKDNPKALFVLDPPYLATECGMYKSYWGLRDYLDVLKLLPGIRYIFFTSEKSQLVELCAWLEESNFGTSPMAQANIRTRQNSINYHCRLDDIMITSVK